MDTKTVACQTKLAVQRTRYNQVKYKQIRYKQTLNDFKMKKKNQYAPIYTFNIGSLIRALTHSKAFSYYYQILRQKPTLRITLITTTKISRTLMKVTQVAQRHTDALVFFLMDIKRNSWLRERERERERVDNKKYI